MTSEQKAKLCTADKVKLGVRDYYSCAVSVYGGTRKCYEHLVAQRKQARQRKGVDAKTWEDEHRGQKPTEEKLDGPRLTRYQRHVAWKNRKKEEEA